MAVTEPRMIIDKQVAGIAALLGKLDRPFPDGGIAHLTFEQAGDLIMSLRAGLPATPEHDGRTLADYYPQCICGPDSTGEAPDERPDCPVHGIDAEWGEEYPEDAEEPF
jgi:hypothetical protein